jgi:hypothetical protein
MTCVANAPCDNFHSPNNCFSCLWLGHNMQVHLYAELCKSHRSEKGADFGCDFVCDFVCDLHGNRGWDFVDLQFGA